MIACVQGTRIQMSTLKVFAEVSAPGSEATPVPVSPQHPISLKHVSFCSSSSQGMFKLVAGLTCSLPFSCSCASKGSQMQLTHAFISAGDFTQFGVQVQVGQCTVLQGRAVNEPPVLEPFSVFCPISFCGNLSNLQTLSVKPCPLARTLVPRTPS